MIGNDIVDINYSSQNSDWKRSGFLKKLFSDDERLHIDKAICSENMVWRFWSMKESTYKAVFRNSNKRAFNPLKFVCSLVDDTRGHVHYQDRIFQTHSSIEKSSIHSMAWEDGGDSSRLNLFLKDFETQVSSADLYQYLLEKVAKIINCSVKDLTLRKSDSRVPEIFKEDQKVDILCSLSHHGQFGGILIYC